MAFLYHFSESGERGRAGASVREIQASMRVVITRSGEDAVPFLKKIDSSAISVCIKHVLLPTHLSKLQGIHHYGLTSTYPF